MRSEQLSVGFLAVLLACGGDPETRKVTGTDTSDTRDSDSHDSDTHDSDTHDSDTHDSGTLDDCADAPRVTWSSWGQGFLMGHCQGCHASTAIDRYGAPEEIVFDTVDDTWTHANAILSTATEDPITMPPSGGVDPDERTLLAAWLTCATPGT